MITFTKLDKFMAERVLRELGPEAVRIKVEYSLPKNTMVVGPDVFRRISDMASVLFPDKEQVTEEEASK